MDIDLMIRKLSELTTEYGLRLLGAIAIAIIGLWIIKTIMRWLTGLMNKRELDPSLMPFIRGLIGALLKILLVISVLSTLGIEMTSFIAILGAVGLAIGMALSGTLQNFAGGVIILIFKPYRVGDVIEAQGYLGKVYQIQIFNTILKTPDNKTVIIPNGSVSNSSLTNFSTEDTRRVDWTFGIAYGDDADKTRKIIEQLCLSDSRILKEPEPLIVVSALAESSVNFTVRVWVKSSDYWDVFFSLNEKVYKTFPSEGIHIPFPNLQVHIQQK